MPQGFAQFPLRKGEKLPAKAPTHVPQQLAGERALACLPRRRSQGIWSSSSLLLEIQLLRFPGIEIA